MDSSFSYPSVLNIVEVSHLDIPVKQTPPQRLHLYICSSVLTDRYFQFDFKPMSQ